MEKLLTKTVKLSSKGQLVLPIALRRNLNLRDGDELSLELNDSNEIILRKLPSALDWSHLIADIPIEVVDVDDEGNYDPEKAPRFHEWMMED
ncbi:MAG TPA: AbrB/MazE/SpoVT family DNA-binding domain-containing protein [Flavobacterium sp.]|nr:AbrB/MazE/SpoVT family DNA-binding domain-containing protein [Flavobacterium sp.]